MEESFAKYRFINLKTGRIVYEMILNNQLSCDEQQERLSKMNQEIANKQGLEYGDIFWEYLGDC